MDPIPKLRQGVDDKLSLRLRLNEKHVINIVLWLQGTYVLTIMHAPYHTPFITVSYFNRGPQLPEDESQKAVVAVPRERTGAVGSSQSLYESLPGYAHFVILTGDHHKPPC